VRILRQAEQARALGVSRWTVGRIRENDPTYPAERQVSPGITGVLADEFDQWLRSRPLVGESRRRLRKPEVA
jgi:predicted DNA-binding transcriptional regulator AlpA